MSVLLQMADHYRILRQQTADEIALIEGGTLVIIRQGKNHTMLWKAELLDRLAKIDRLLQSFDTISQQG